MTVNVDGSLPPRQKHPNKVMAKEPDVRISAVELLSSVKREEILLVNPHQEKEYVPQKDP